MPALESAPWWLEPTLIVGALAVLGTFVTVAINRAQERRDRRRQSFAEAFAAIAHYWEFPYVVRRRRHDQPEAERIRISEQLVQVQRQIAFYEAWMDTESKRVAKAYRNLVATSRQVMGAQIHDGWLEPPARDDASMNIATITREGLEDASGEFFRAVKDHLSLVPAPFIRLLRRFGHG